MVTRPPRKPTSSGEGRAGRAWSVLLELPADDDRRRDGLIAALRNALHAQRLPVGSVLPPSRVLAAELGCSRWAVTEAYAQLRAEGYLRTRTGSVTQVRWTGGEVERSGPAQAAAPVPARFDLAPGLPDLRAFPRKRWMDALRDAGASASFELLGLSDPIGELRLRQVVAGYLSRARGATTGPAEVAVTAGTTDAVVTAARTLGAAGRYRMAVEDPGWTRLRAAVAGCGVEVVGVGVDAGGLRVQEIPPDVRSVLVAPAHQFPTGTVLAPERRAALQDWARRVDGIVIEDDYDAEFRYDARPVGVLQGGDPGHVLLLGSVSKTLAPALRLGWALVPKRRTDLVAAFRGRPAAPPVLDQLALAGLIDSGGYDRQLRAVRRTYRARRDALAHELARRLPECELSGTAAGLHFVLRLPGGADAAAITRRAAASGVHVVDLDDYRIEPDPLEPGLVLGYGNITANSLSEAVDRLAQAIP